MRWKLAAIMLDLLFCVLIAVLLVGLCSLDLDFPPLP